MDEPPVSTQTGSTPAPTAAKTATTPPPFRPPDFEPPFEKSRAPEDGHWVPLGSAERHELSAEQPYLLFKTSVHPHKTSRFKRMDVVAADLRQLSLHWTIGKADKGADKLAPHMTPGVIPSDQQENTVAVFNGGFLARHGRWGQMSHGVEVVPPRDIGCTLAIMQSGQVQISPWSELAQTEGIHAYRQSTPCLVHQAEVHPKLLSGQDKLWAGRNPNRKTRRRSAVGIDASGKILFYAVGTETEAVDLARGMQAVGAASAMQLDINWNWTRFLIAGRRDEKPRVTSTLIEDMAHGKNEYFSWPSQRDFFHLVRR